MSKTRQKLDYKKPVKLTDHTRAFNDLTNFGNGITLVSNKIEAKIALVIAKSQTLQSLIESTRLFGT